ncbi:MAG: hypothetical protein E7452_02840 [Ruminococcaceae bacterium]|nr:hypothetical protein [Oscillospiraceae bacterium]
MAFEEVSQLVAADSSGGQLFEFGFDAGNGDGAVEFFFDGRVEIQQFFVFSGHFGLFGPEAAVGAENEFVAAETGFFRGGGFRGGGCRGGASIGGGGSRSGGGRSGGGRGGGSRGGGGRVFRTAATRKDRRDDHQNGQHEHENTHSFAHFGIPPVKKNIPH